MANKCENCIHFDMCAELHAYYHKVDKEKVIPFMVDKNSEELNCDHFKDKSLIVELPCKVGDEIYYIGGVNKDIVNEATVMGIYITESGFSFKLERNLCYWDEQAEDVFLTKEEAEAKLKEVRG